MHISALLSCVTAILLAIVPVTVVHADILSDRLRPNTQRRASPPAFKWHGQLISQAGGRFRDEQQQLLLSTPKKLCHLSDSGRLICKTPAQIEHDLGTFIRPEVVAEILDILENTYDELKLNRQNGMLTQCAGTYVATPVQTASPLAQPGSSHRAPVTVAEKSSAVSACRTAALRNISGGSSGGLQLNTDYQQQVSSAKARGDAVAASCQTSLNQQYTGIIPFVAAALGIGLPEATAVVVAAGGAVVGAAGYLLNEWIDDGWSDWESTAPDTKMRYKEDDPSMKQYKNSAEKTTTTVTGTPDGGRMEYTEHSDGSTTVKKLDKDGKVVSTETFDKDGMPKGSADDPPPGQPASPPSNPVPGGGASQPAPDAMTCAEKQARWAAFKERCDRSGWQSYECVQYIRVMNNCPDQNLINPGPDGDLTCQSRNPPPSSAKLLCDRRKMFERSTPDALSNCSLLDQNLMPGMRPAICLDPRAMCPDNLRQGQGPSSRRPGL